MAVRPRAVYVLGAASLLGLFGELLFHDAAFGFNIFCWIIALGVGAVGLSKWLNQPIPKIAFYAAPAILVFAACFSFREAPELKFANGLALFLIVGALLVRTKGGSFTQSSISELTWKAVGAWFKLTADFATLVVKEVNWSKDEASKERSRAVVRGIALATPLVLVFAGLFCSADDAFRVLITKLFSFEWLDGSWLFQTVCIFLFCAVMSAGTYRVLLMEKRADAAVPPVVKDNWIPKLGMTEIAVVFGLLNALFGLFVVVQAQYFFGGIHHLKSVDGLTFAEYARHGFFELAVVATGALATILGFHSMMKEPGRNQLSFSILAGILTSFVAVIMVSAFQRMNLYVFFAGLTQLRVYTTAFMVWIAAVLIWLAATVLRGDRKRFASGAMVAGLAAIVALNVINPDAAIAGFNLNHVGRQADLAYLESLSIDAAPAVLNGASRLPAKQAEELRQGVRKQWSRDVDTDWRGFNYARWRYLNQYRSEL